jgi:ribosomal protein S18 acetylase RimI-like enzyme
MESVSVRPLTLEDRAWAERFVTERWGAPVVVVHGAVYRVDEAPGFVVISGEGERVGLVTYYLADDACEIVSLDSTRPGVGVGTALVDAVGAAARRLGCRRVWLITTNDNLHALRFYQKRGFVLVAVHRDAVAAARALKPEIPLIGDDGIPIRDEIELELTLER